jgi:hypothetical protein
VDKEFYTHAQDVLDPLIDALDVRYSKVIRLRFGLDGENDHSRTLEAVGKEMKLTRERIRQIEAKGLRLLYELVDKQDIAQYAEVGDIPNHWRLAYALAMRIKYLSNDPDLIDKAMLTRVKNRLGENNGKA